MKIPNRVRITSKVEYEVLFVEEFKDGQTLGECRSDVKQIVINKNQSDTEARKTFIHETIHAIDSEEDIKLTEKQVRKLEDGIYRVLRLNKWI